MILPDRIRIGTETRTVRLWLPDEPPHAVLLMTDGQNAFPRHGARAASWNADRIAAESIRTGAIVPIAIVAIHARGGVRRWEEYLPYPDPFNASTKRFEADRFADVVVPTVIEAVRRRYSRLARVRRIAIGGSSYGAVAALHAAIRRPRAFDALLLESAPVWVGTSRLIEDARAARITSRAWIGVGTAESRSPDKSAELVRLTRSLGAALRPTAEIRVRVAEGAPHHESAWAARLPGALRWLFGA